MNPILLFSFRIRSGIPNRTHGFFFGSGLQLTSHDWIFRLRGLQISQLLHVAGIRGRNRALRLCGVQLSEEFGDSRRHPSGLKRGDGSNGCTSLHSLKGSMEVQAPTDLLVRMFPLLIDSWRECTNPLSFGWVSGGRCLMGARRFTDGFGFHRIESTVDGHWSATVDC